jgi:hypothetical protein
MVDALAKRPSADPIRVCPACGDVMFSGTCNACAPSPAGPGRHADTAAHYAAVRPNKSSAAFDSRRAATEWVVGPEEADPHTRKAHPAQLKAARFDHEAAPATGSRGKRQTQIYRQGVVAPNTGAAPPPRPWTQRQPGLPQAVVTAPHARPSVATSAQGPSAPVESHAPTRAAPPPSPARPIPAVVEPRPLAARIQANTERHHPRVDTAIPSPHDAMNDASDEPAPRTRPRLALTVAAVALAAGALVALVAAFTR